MGTLSLSEREVSNLFGLLQAAAGEPGLALPWPFLERLKDLIGCDVLEFCGIDTMKGVHYLVQSLEGGDHEESPDEEPADPGDPFWRHFWDSRPCCYPDTSGDFVTVTMLSDFYSAPQWHDNGMYVDHFGRYGIEHEIMVCLPDGAGRSLRLIGFRGAGPDFGERERLLLTLLRPHVAEAYRAAARRRAGQVALTPRQREILGLVRMGHTNRQIARQMRLSEGTVRTHLNHIFGRLEVTSRTAAVTRAEALLV